MSEDFVLSPFLANPLDRALSATALAAKRAGFAHPPWNSLAAARQYFTLLKLTREILPPGAHVLDWGCGQGFYSHILLQMGYRVSGYEFHTPALISELKALGGDRYDFVLASEPIQLPYSEHSFDAIASIGVLEHVRETGGNETASLRELRRILRPNGSFLCYHFPNKRSWIDALSRRTIHGGHPFLYDQRDIKQLLEDSHFNLEQINRYGMVPRNTLARLPSRITRTEKGANSIDTVDRIITSIFGAYSQNWTFVASPKTSK